MKSSHTRRILLDMAIMVAASLLVGVLWNRTILINAWNGNPVAAQTTAPAAPAAGAVAAPALPLGLMQVKDFYDRKEAVIVDARDKDQFKNGHIDGAISFPLGEADAGMAGFRKRVPPESMIVAYCNGFDCHDSKTLAEKLIGAGYGSVFIFEGGFPEWRDAGYPVGKGL